MNKKILILDDEEQYLLSLRNFLHEFNYAVCIAMSSDQFADAYARLAQFYRDKGDKEKYHSYLDKALELDPQNELALMVQRYGGR